MNKQQDKCTVLVTGAAGFLGQHVVSALHNEAHHVTHIRAFDRNKFVDNTEYKKKKPVRVYVGDINDSTMLDEICRNVDCVIHLAALIELHIFNNREKSHHVNVEGTKLLLHYAKQHGVKRFLFCSSMATINGFDDVFQATESSIKPPAILKYPAYGETKLLAERLVLSSNCEEFRTLAIVPGMLYGDKDLRHERRVNKAGIDKTRFIMEFGHSAFKDWVYAGNVAHAFMKAEETLRDEKKWKKAGGETFLIGDETPKLPKSEYYSPLEEFFPEAGFKPSLPVWAFRLFILISGIIGYTISVIAKPIFKKKITAEYWNFWPNKQVFLFSYGKARQILDYKPIYSYQQAKHQTIEFLRSLKGHRAVSTGQQSLAKNK